MRSYFILSPGLQRPDQFQLRGAPPLLAIQDLWEHARYCQPSLIFRVRSESAPEAPIGPLDTLESCVGLVDSATRWRTVFRMVNTLTPAVVHPALAQVVGNAIQFLTSTHPAGVTAAQRRAIMQDIAKVAMAEGEGAPHPFEVAIADGVATLAQCDGDMEAASVAPLLGALVPFAKGAPEFAARVATVETMSGAFLLAEAAARLSERAPNWIFSRMPSLARGDDTAESQKQERHPDDEED